MNYEDQYLSILNIRAEKPSLAFLSALVKRHQAVVPYENLSKLIRAHSVGPTIPSFEEYIEEMRSFGYGGTCFAQNCHFLCLLQYLGFQAELRSIKIKGAFHHPSIVVCLSAVNYYVDLGLMSSFSGPFEISPEKSFEKQIGPQTFQFEALTDGISSDLKIYRDGVQKRHLQATEAVLNISKMADGVKETFNPTSLFMTTLAVHRALPDQDVGVWNTNFYKIKGLQQETQAITSYAELESIFVTELLLPKADLKSALRFLEENTGKSLFQH